MSSLASDHRSLPNHVLNLYLYGMMAWAVLLLGLFFSGYFSYGIPLCYLLWLWQAGLTLWWGRSTLAGFEDGDFSKAEAAAGVRTVGGLLAGSALLPALIFLCVDPFDPTKISTCIGAAILSALAYGAVILANRAANRYAYVVALTLAALALPVNTSGTVTVATFVGLWDVVVEHAPTPPLPGR